MIHKDVQQGVSDGHGHVSVDVSHMPHPATAVDELPFRPLTLNGRFDCEADAQNWKTGWSKAKKEWCCKNHGRGCKGAEPKAEGR